MRFIFIHLFACGSKLRITFKTHFYELEQFRHKLTYVKFNIRMVASTSVGKNSVMTGSKS